MRTITIAAAVLICAATAFAQDTAKTQLSVTTSNLGFGETRGQSEWSGGVAVALSRAWSPRWSTELGVAAERHKGLFTMFEQQPFQPIGVVVPFTVKRSFTVFPVDLTTQYRFTNSSRWTPYVFGGIRYVAAPAGDNSSAAVPTANGFMPVTGGFAFGGDRTSAEIGAGTSLRITPHFGLRFDATRLLRSDEVNYDPRVRAAFGVSWRF
jgi:Outer membrane protein beta-barrel domain